MSWSIERRLEFIEMKLFWEGRFNRSALIEQFKVSVPQASADIRRYLERRPGVMAYDPVSRGYLPTETFEPVIYRPSADLYLARICALAEGVLSPGEAVVGNPPQFAIVPTIHRRLDNDVVRRVVLAIRQGLAMKVVYQSFSTPQPRSRWIAPHAVAHDGRRWHARAFCCEKNRFSDFALGRIIAVDATRPAGEVPKDEAWTSSITFVLAPHPGLSPGMRRAVQIDYDMTDGVAHQEVRVALAYYLSRQLGLERDPEQTPAEQYHVIALNRLEIEAAIEAQSGAAPRETVQ